MKIANKVIVALLSVAVFPLVITQTLVKLILSVNEESLAFKFLNMILGDDNAFANNRLGVEESILDLFKRLTGQSKGAFDIDLKTLASFIPAEQAKIKGFVIASACMLALGLLIAVIILGCALFTDAYKTIACLGLGGSACFLASDLLFHQAAKPFLDGTIDVTKIIASMLEANGTGGSGLATALLSNTVSVDVLTLSGAVFFGLFLLLGVAAWEFAYVVTLPKENQPKAKKA